MQIGPQFYDQDIFIDDDGLDDVSRPGLLLIGNYNWLAGGTAILYVAICPEKLLRAEIQRTTGSGAIPVIPENIYTATFVINPYAAFSGIPRQMFEDADTNINDVEIEYIIISPDENEELYDFILFRLAQNITATIE